MDALDGCKGDTIGSTYIQRVVINGELEMSWDVMGEFRSAKNPQ